MSKHLNLYLCCAVVLSVILLNACTSTPPALASGDDIWLLKTVTYPSSIKTATGDTITPTDANFKFIHAEFECLEGKSLTSLWSGMDDSMFSNYSIYQRDGFPDVFITNADGDKYLAVVIETCGIAGLVPNDGKGFILQFKDLEPVALDQ